MLFNIVNDNPKKCMTTPRAEDSTARTAPSLMTIIDGPSLDSACISAVIHSTAPLEVCEPESALPPWNNLEVLQFFSLHNIHNIHNPQALEDADPRHMPC